MTVSECYDMNLSFVRENTNGSNYTATIFDKNKTKITPPQFLTFVNKEKQRDR